MGEAQDPRRLVDWLETAWERVRDPYWRLDHPEVAALIVAVVSGLVGLIFQYLGRRLAPQAE